MAFFAQHRQVNVVIGVISIILILASLNPEIAECRNVISSKSFSQVEYSAINCRKHHASLTEYGGVGNGETLNTNAFRSAIANLSEYASDGGAQLVVPQGRWLTGSFNLTSHFTLFLLEGAEILATEDESQWPIIPPLPSYGKGRDGSDLRFASLIFGSNLTDVVISGNNGTINGQGAPWWDKYYKGQLNVSRPYLIEIMFSNEVQISNITLINSPSWNVHPVYCSDVLIQGLTVLATTEIPNTDGINPDSCNNTRIEDCYIVSGDDCIAVKSGWDQYGIKVGKPTQHLIIRSVTCVSRHSAAIALGSEMSGGIKDVRVENITAIDTESGVRIKTAPGRGGYVKDIFIRNMRMKNINYVFWMTGDYGSHPDKGYDPNVLAKIQGINYRDIVAENATISGALDGPFRNPFTGICMSNVTIALKEKVKELQWNCTNISGVSRLVTPLPCNSLPETDAECTFPEDTLPIDNLQMKTCFANIF